MKHNEKPKQTRNKELTKRKLIDAVGEIFRTEGHTGLGVNKVARIAGVSKKMIYAHFEGSFNRLVEEYILETDYWMVFSDRVNELIDHQQSDSQKLITDILQNQFRYFHLNKQMQKLILWEICTDTPLMKSIHQVRENAGQKIMELTDRHFANSNVNFRAVAGLLGAGIYYTILHTRFKNRGVYSDIDLSTEEGRDEMLRAIEMIVGWAYRAAEVKITP